jgi:hydrogenase nickel incorporation protein HypB
VGVVDGDIATSLDAERAAAAGAISVQINTGGSCHLDAPMVRTSLDELPLADLDLLVVENVGNLICPASFRLGTHFNVLVASLPEGDDKPFKYPTMYRGVDLVLLNKVDLAAHLDFDEDRFREGVRALNEEVDILPISCRTGEGLETWVEWVKVRAEEGRIAAGS